MINVTEATIVKDKMGPDSVLLKTNLPSSYPKTIKNNAILRMDVEAGEGENYVKAHFPNIRVITIPA